MDRDHREGNRGPEQVQPRLPAPGHAGRVAWNGERSWSGNSREVVTMNQPHMAPWWFPANDHPRDKATLDLHISVPRGKQAVANGRLVRRTPGARWTTWHWRASEPMAPYLAFFAAGRFALDAGRTQGGTPYLLAVSRELTSRQQGRAMRLLRQAPRIVTWLEGWLGAYPFDSTGGLTTALDPGFATPQQWLETMWASRSASFWKVRISDPGPEQMFHTAVYDRGAMAVQAMRSRIGDYDFRQLLRSWVQEHRHANASVRDFTALAEKISGEDLDGFFEAWLMRKERPVRTAENGLGDAVTRSYRLRVLGAGCWVLGAGCPEVMIR